MARLFYQCLRKGKRRTALGRKPAVAVPHRPAVFGHPAVAGAAISKWHCQREGIASQAFIAHIQSHTHTSARTHKHTHTHTHHSTLS